MLAKRSPPATKADLRALETRLEKKISRLATKTELQVVKEDVHVARILGERLESKVDAMHEDQNIKHEALLGEIKELGTSPFKRLDDLEDVVRRHSGDIDAIQRRLRISK